MLNKGFVSLLKIMPGFLLAAVVAVLARLSAHLLPVHFISASVLALFAGMIMNVLLRPGKVILPGLTFTSKKILKFAIILLGASLSIHHVLLVGRLALIILFFTLITCFGGGYLLGKLFNINWKLSGLIATGTGICGGSAIAAVAPVIEADNKDIAYAISVTFLFDIAMIILFPIMGFRLGLNDMAYGLWTGTAINDTSSVVAAGYALTESSGDYATMVKLTRTLLIIPVVLAFSFIHIRKNLQALRTTSQSVLKRAHIGSLFPWFIAGFICLAILNSTGAVPLALSAAIKEASRFFMVCALAAIGLNTNLKEMRQSGISPLMHAVILSSLVVIVSIGAAYTIGIV